MQTSDAILHTYGMSQMVLQSYVGDLTDAELLQRPHEDCNHIAWQLGHLISSEARLLESVAPGKGIELPEGFAEKHDKENAGSNDPADFSSKEEYLALFAKLKEALQSAVTTCSAEDLDAPGPEFLKGFADTAGAVYVLIATHPMMHVGQFVPVRRALGKPVVI